ncbi:hypothetical protein [Actinoplanes solisilvae]|uniref:hypothetical protein n=1 Tax=Actinoplanes solisilvae TaxID=2486853 RepID=UPI000FD85F70|nr:hypothetical protein [Actinoplanes solisilvae]
MSDGEFVGYAGALALGGLVMLVLAVLGTGQGLILRAADVLAGLAFLGYAGYLMVAAPSSPFMSWFVMATPVLGVVVAVVAQRHSEVLRKRLEENLMPQPYAGHDAPGHAERKPFPSPPPPLDPSSPTPARPRPTAQAERAGKEMPSGLPAISGLGDRPLEASARPKRPSGLPPAPTDYRARHDSGENASHDYAAGRHRADGES